MITEKIEKILNEQIEKEGYSSNLYLSMASWAETEGFAGISTWFYAQAGEELLHMMKFIHFINERGGHAIIPAFDQPPVNFDGIKKVFDQVLEHERFISGSINDIAALAIKENDFATQNWIQWFITEQVEEESSVQGIIDKLNLLGEENMYLFDRDIMSLRGTGE
ncbi:MAG: ferritin [Bacteroidales bacterium]|nr:ferritin [Bacteroidales bacterium]